VILRQTLIFVGKIEVRVGMGGGGWGWRVERVLEWWGSWDRLWCLCTK